MSNLTDDERTVLMIADQGESMMPLGRWEQPVEHLVELGYLERHDKFNNTITPAGKQALGEANEAVDDAAARALIKAHNTRVVYRKSGELLAQSLVEMAKAAAEATGDEPILALQKCVASLRDRAVELLTPPSRGDFQ